MGLHKGQKPANGRNRKNNGFPPLMKKNLEKNEKKEEIKK